MDEKQFREAARECIHWLFYEFDLSERYEPNTTNEDLKNSHRIADNKLGVLLEELGTTLDDL